MRKSKQKSIDAQAPILTVKQEKFGVMAYDLPASEIGDNVHSATNVHIYPERIEGRTGSKLATRGPTSLPKYPDYTSFRAYQVDHTVYRVSGTAFDESLIGKWLCWPTEPPWRTEIVGIIDEDQLLVARKGTFAEQGGAYIQGKVYGHYQHKVNKRFILHIDTRLFIASLTDSSWTEIFQMGFWTMAESKSYIFEFDDYVIVKNLNGMFKINLTADYPYYFKMDSPPPVARIVDVLETEILTYGRNYIYSCSRLIGNDRWRYTKGVERDRDRTDTDFSDGETFIEQESGTTIMDQNRKDYGEVYTQDPIGPNETCGILICGAGLNIDIDDWRAITDGSFAFTVNGAAYNVMCNFINAETMEDVAEIIQDGIRSFFPTFEVYIDPNNGLPRFVMIGPQVDGYTTAFLAATGTGTDISTGATSMLGTAADGAALATGATDPDHYFNRQSVIGTLTAAPAYGGGYEHHWTNFTIYGTKNTGPKGKEQGNNPDAYTFVADVPIGKAFTSAITQVAGNPGTLVLTQGMLSYADIGSIIEYEDGTRARIYDVTAVNAGTVVDVAAGSTTWTGGNVASQSSATGNQNGVGIFGVMTLAQTGTALTIASGYALQDTDRGKPIFFSDGSIGYVVTVNSTTTATMLSSATKVTQAACINANSRAYCDRVTDKILDDRFHYDPFTPDNRYMIELPATDLCVAVPGFVVVAKKDTNKIYYTPLGKESSHKTFAGSYNPARHFDDKMEESIKRIGKFPDMLIVQCLRTTWGCPTNVPMVEEIKDFGIVISVLPPLELIADIGIIHPEAADSMGIGKEIVITSEPAVRFFDGNAYGAENLADKQVMKVLRKIANQAIGWTNPFPEGGFVIAGSEVE